MLGSLPVMFVPFERTPFPRFVFQGSTDCCPPYTLTGKLPRFELIEFFAPQSNRLSVALGRAPPASVSLIQASIPSPLPTALPQPMLSKYQSLPRLLESWAKL